MPDPRESIRRATATMPAPPAPSPSRLPWDVPAPLSAPEGPQQAAEDPAAEAATLLPADHRESTGPSGTDFDETVDPDDLPGTRRGPNHRYLTLSLPAETRALLDQAALDDSRGAAAMDAVRASYEYLLTQKIERPGSSGPFPAPERRVSRRRRNLSAPGNVAVSVTNLEARVLADMRDDTGRSMSELFTMAIEHYWRPLLETRAGGGD